MFYSDDPIADFERHDSEMEEQLKKLPVCCICKDHIQQEKAVHIKDEWYCDGCLDEAREDIDGWN